ncbi:MAG: GNAT family N-acetyltransferase [Pseudomonadota bacterium]
MSKEKILIRPATPADAPQMRELLPRLAEFQLPTRRRAEDLWRSDEAMLLSWVAGNEPDFFAHVAILNDQVIGTVFVRMREELLSHEPSAHLEVLVMAQQAEGRGIGGKLVEAAEDEAKRRGAASMTLHVFANNERARRLYDRAGYDGELLRYIKDFD